LTCNTDYRSLITVFPFPVSGLPPDSFALHADRGAFEKSFPRIWGFAVENKYFTVAPM
jgi:hypothetical protein